MVRSPALSHGLQASGACWVMVATAFWSCSTRVHLVGATPAAPVEHCDATGCTLENAYALWNDRSTSCKAASVVYPTTEQEIVKAVADAVRSNRKIKVATSTSHSIPKLACPGSPSGVILSTRKYASIVNIDTQLRTVTAQGGILLRSLVDAIAGQGLALPVSPYWEGLTLAGLLSTSSHGSSLFGKGGAVHEYVIGMRIVVPASAAEGYGGIKVLRTGDEDLNAAKVSLGVLGVISTVTLQLEPAFKRSVTLEMVKGDEELEDKILQIAQNEEFGDTIWYPSLGQVVYRYDQRVPVETPGEGKNNFIGFQPLPVAALAPLRTAEELADATRNRQLKCNLVASVFAQQAIGYGFFKNGKAYGGFPVIGHQNLIQTAGGCQTSPVPGLYCPWDARGMGIVFNDGGAALPLSRLRDFIGDVRALRSAVPQSLCDLDLYNGILFRFAKQSSGAYLGTAQADSAMLDFTFSRGNDPKAPRLDQDVLQELEQILFDKYGATPHWGKNRNYVFEGVAKKYRNLNRFLDVKNRFDPTGLFSSEWSDALLGLNRNGAPGVSIYQPYCAIEGLCRCTTDEHCAPEKNSFCRPGRIYPAARVCRSEV